MKRTKTEDIKTEENQVIVATYNRSATRDDGMIEERNKLLNQYCGRKGYKIFKSYIDNGYGGGNLNRPALQEMLEDMKKGAFKKLVVTDMGRLSRNICNFEDLLKDFEKYNCDLELVRGEIDTFEPSGKLFTIFVEVAKQFEQELINKKISNEVLDEKNS